MEVSFKYFLIKLEILVPILLSYLLIGGTTIVSDEKYDLRLRQATTLIIAVFYVYKFFIADSTKKQIEIIIEDNKLLKNDIEELKNDIKILKTQLFKNEIENN